jgi:hypothetical protein
MKTMGLEKKLLESEKIYLSKRARHIDKVDMLFGPASVLAYLSGSEYLFSAGIALSMIELCVVKLPFITRYVSKTKDYKSLYYFCLKELMLNVGNYGGFVDIFPSYTLRVDYMLNKK